jgi:hypothetical protein
MAVEFRTGEGEHGFGAEEEAGLYGELGEWFWRALGG